MNRYDINFFLFFILALIVVLSVKDYQLKQISNYYLFEINKTENIYGFVSNSEIYDDRDGVRSFKYVVRYSFRSKVYILKESLSLFPLSEAHANDSILVKLLPDNPKVATIKSTKIRIADLILAGLVTILEIIMIVKFFRYLKEWIKMRFHFKSDGNK